MACQNLTMSQIASYAAAAGCPPGDPLAYAVAIAAAESSGRTCARNPKGEDSRGLWQINLPVHPEFAGWDLYDPAVNAQAMVQLSRGCTRWGDWSAYSPDQTYLKFLDQARAAAGAPAPQQAVTPPPAQPPVDDGGAPIVLTSLPGYVAFDPSFQTCAGQTYQSPDTGSWSCSGQVSVAGAGGSGATIAGIDLSLVPWYVWALIAVGIGAMFL
jgi:hypothetical protein